MTLLASIHLNTESGNLIDQPMLAGVRTQAIKDKNATCQRHSFTQACLHVHCTEGFIPGSDRTPGLHLPVVQPQEGIVSTSHAHCSPAADFCLWTSDSFRPALSNAGSSGYRLPTLVARWHTLCEMHNWHTSKHSKLRSQQHRGHAMAVSK